MTDSSCTSPHLPHLRRSALALACVGLLGLGCSIPNPDFGRPDSSAEGSEGRDEGDMESGESGAQDGGGATMDAGDELVDMGGGDPGDGDGDSDPGETGDSGTGADTGDEMDDQLCEDLGLELPQLDDDCDTCLEYSCCAELSECADDANCQCVFECMADDGTALLCNLECGLDELADVLGLVDDLLICINLDCGESCPVLSDL